MHRRRAHTRAVVRLVCVALVACLVTPTLSEAQPRQGDDARGCWESSRVLGPSYLGTDPRRDPRDSAFRVFRLTDLGQVSLPLLANASLWNERSVWRQAGDTLYVRIFTGLQGWDVTLRGTGALRTGSARYLTDAVSTMVMEPLAVRFVRVPCRAEWPTPPRLSSRRSMLPVHFLHDVSTPPRLLTKPRALSVMEPLRDNDSTPRSTPRASEAVRVQYVINEDGRVDTASVMDLSNTSRHAPLRPALVMALQSATFTPALKGKVEVPVLTQWWVTLRR
jgi:hypothetical protein